MILIDNEGNHDPRINLALEEYVVRNFNPEEDYVLFYVNQPSLIIGKNQNTIEEINTDYVKKKDIIVVRRISGGGTVYHDFGNLNFSFLTRYDPSRINNFAQFNQPIMEALKSLGISAEMTGRNDIVADGKKISGNAQFSTTKKMFSHGTLLFDSDMSQLSKSLNVKPDKIESKGMKSVRSRVANISELLDSSISLNEFKQIIMEFIFKKELNRTYQLNEQEWEGVYELSKNKYQTWEWNYGRSPEFNIQRIHRFPFGQIDARIHVKENRVIGIKFYGDFLAHGDVAMLEQKLIGTRYEQNSFKSSLMGVDLKQYFGELSIDAFSEFMCDL